MYKRQVFGLLNALPLAGAGAALKGEAAEAGAIAESAREPGAAPAEEVARPTPDQAVAPAVVLPNRVPPTRLELLRGLGQSVASFSDEMLAQIAKVSAVDDDMLRLMQVGRPPTPLLADTISRFRIDQELEQAAVAVSYTHLTLPTKA